MRAFDEYVAGRLITNRNLEKCQRFASFNRIRLDQDFFSDVGSSQVPENEILLSKAMLFI